MSAERCLIIRIKDLEAVSGACDPSTGQSEAECYLRRFLEGRDIPVKDSRDYSEIVPVLLTALEKCLPALGWANCSDGDIEREVRLGNGYAELITIGRQAIQKAKP